MMEFYMLSCMTGKFVSSPVAVVAPGIQGTFSLSDIFGFSLANGVEIVSLDR
jgi:hypothetical protein